MPFITNTPEKLKAARKSRRKSYYKNRDKNLKRITSRIKSNKAYILSVKKGSVCADCNLDNYICLEFDHLPEYEKTYALSNTKCWSWGRKRIDEEIAKCEVVCGNCHKIRTHDRREQKKNHPQGVESLA